MRGLRLLILAVAIAAGVGAVALVQNELERARLAAESPTVIAPERIVEEAPKTDVLVASRDMNMGELLEPSDLRWQSWPVEAVSEFFITREAQPDIIETIENVIVRGTLVAGEPLTDTKMLRLDRPGVMSAMLRDGMRAIAVEISPESGAGGFILPGDYVDIILTRDVEVVQGADVVRMDVTNTLMRAVRVLAIDQYFEQGDGDASEVGRTATLEVTPAQAENLALAEESGVLTLTLRGVSELVSRDGADPIEPEPETAFDLRELGVGSELHIPGSGDMKEITVIRGSHKQRTIVE